MISLLSAGLLVSDPVEVRFSAALIRNGELAMTVDIVSKLDRNIRIYRPLSGSSVYPNDLFGVRKPSGQVVDYEVTTLFTTVLQGNKTWSEKVHFTANKLPVPYEGAAILFRFVYTDCWAADFFREVKYSTSLPEGAWGSAIFIASSRAGRTIYRQLERMSVPVSDSYLKPGLRLVADLRSGRGLSQLAVYSKDRRTRVRSMADLQGKVRIDSEERAKDFVSLRTAELTWHLFDDRRYRRSKDVYWNQPMQVAKISSGFRVTRLATDTKFNRLVELTETVSSEGQYHLVARKEVSRTDIPFRLDNLRLPEGD